MAAVGDTSSSKPTVATLCGMVIRAPRILVSVNRERKKAGKSSGLLPIGTTTAFAPHCANQGL